MQDKFFIIFMFQSLENFSSPTKKIPGSIVVTEILGSLLFDKAPDR